MRNDKYYSLLVNAFINDPMGQIIFKDENNWHEAVKRIFSFMFDLGTRYGELITTDNNEGLLVYMSSYLKCNNLINQVKTGGLKLLFTLGIRNFINILNYEKYSQYLQKKYARKDDVYLYILAVDPIYQKRGIGSKLIQSLQKRLEVGQRIYLETSNPINIPFYEQHGFEKQEDFILPGSTGFIWPMIYEKM